MLTPVLAPGFMPDMTFEQAGPMKLHQGDIIIIGTDGIWEAENQHEQMFGKERMLEVIRKNRNLTTQKIANAVVQAVLDFTNPMPVDDDITIIIMKVK